MQQKNFLIIQGLTKQNENFRPSDWAERICNLLAAYKAVDPPIKYHRYAVPSIVNGIKCVRIDTITESHYPLYWKFVTEFAQDNHLVTEIVTETIPTKTEMVISRVYDFYESWINKLSAAVVRTYKESSDAN